MSDLTAWLLERIAEDEARAKAAPADWDSPDAFKQDQEHDYQPHEYRCAARGDRCRCGLPARVLAECEALRAVVVEHDGDHDCVRYVDPADNNPCTTLRALAAIWADHPDYREEWRP